MSGTPHHAVAEITVSTGQVALVTSLQIYAMPKHLYFEPKWQLYSAATSLATPNLHQPICFVLQIVLLMHAVLCNAGVGRTGWHIDGSFMAKPFGYSTYHIVSCPSQAGSPPLNPCHRQKSKSWSSAKSLHQSS